MVGEAGKGVRVCVREWKGHRSPVAEDKILVWERCSASGTTSGFVRHTLDIYSMPSRPRAQGSRSINEEDLSREIGKSGPHMNGGTYRTNLVGRLGSPHGWFSHLSRQGYAISTVRCSHSTREVSVAGQRMIGVPSSLRPWNTSSTRPVPAERSMK